jgi:beta-galactosidase
VDQPHLYTARISLLDGKDQLDSEAVSFGIRMLQLDPVHGLRINGESVKLRGSCIHHDNGPLGAISMPAAEERRIRTLKAAGFNAIRSAHNPVSTAALDACDRLGMLVIDEAFDVWTSGKSDFDYAVDFPQWWERDVEAMVTKDFNHPCVVMYSIGNENPETGSPAGSTWARRLAEHVRSLDHTRFVTNGINPMVSMLETLLAQLASLSGTDDARPGGGVNTMMADTRTMMAAVQTSDAATQRTEESFAVLDVAGMNYADSRYPMDGQLFPDRIIVGSETWPTAIAENWALVRGDSRIIGDFTWTGWDYLGETGIGALRYADDSGPAPTGMSAGYPELVAGCGDIDITGRRRPVSYFREIVFGLRSEPYIAVDRPDRYGQEATRATPWAWSDSESSWSWPGAEGKPVRIEVYSDADEVELSLDGVSLGRASVGAERSFRAVFKIAYRPGELTATAYRDGRASTSSSIRSAGSEIIVLVDADRTLVRADHTDLAYLDIALTDSSGVVHSTLVRNVDITLDGPAALQALGTSNPSPTDNFTDSSCTTYQGRALAVIRPTAAGQVTVTVNVSGCAPVVVSLIAE